jgi:GT2 family glycosyltransferase
VATADSLDRIEPMSGSVHIVIVNWDTGGSPRECLASIVRAGRADVELIRSRRNVGFARACNQDAVDSTADYLLLARTLVGVL